MSTEEKKPDGEGGAPNASASENEKANGEEVTAGRRYSFAEPRKKLKERRQAYHGSDPMVLGDFKACDMALDKGTAAVAVVFKCRTDLDSKREQLATARSQMLVALAPVAAQVKATRRGREFYMTCKNPLPWVTFRSVDVGLAEAGIAVNATQLDDARAKATVAEAANAAVVTAETAMDAAHAGYQAALHEVESSLTLLWTSLNRTKVAPVNPSAQPPEVAPGPVPAGNSGSGQAAPGV